MPVLGKSGGGQVTEATATANGAIAAGDPVILSGGLATKISGANASISRSSPGSAYMNNGNNAFLYHYHMILRADSTDNRVAMIAHQDQQSQGNTRLVGSALNANGTHSGVGGPTNGVALKNLQNTGQLYDMIWDSPNSSWIIFGRSSTTSGFFTRAKTTNGSSFSITISSAVSGGFNYQSFVKDASNRIYHIVRATTNNNTSVQRVNFSDSIGSGQSPQVGSAVAGLSHTTTLSSLQSCYDSLNDQIVTISSANATTRLYVINVFDIDSSGVPSLSHSQQINKGTFTDPALGTGTNYSNSNLRSIVDMETDGNGNFACVMGNGGFLGFSNNGSAITLGETRGNFFGSSSLYYTGIFMQTRIPGQFISTSVASFNGGQNAITGTFFSMAGGKVAGGFGTSVIEPYYENTNRANITYTKSQPNYYLQKFAMAGTADVLWTPVNQNFQFSYMSRQDFSASSLNTGSLGGLAKTTASNGASVTVNLPGAEQTGLTSKLTGTKYYVDKLGAIVSTKPESPGAFLGTGLSSTSLLIGKEIDVEDVTKVFSRTMRSMTMTNFETKYQTSGRWDLITDWFIDVQALSVTGTNSLLEVEGSGKVLFFICSNNGTGNSNLGVQVFVVGRNVYETGIHPTGFYQPLTVVGEFKPGSSQSAGDSGNILTHANIEFNESFEVRRMSSSAATSIAAVYRIQGIE